MTIRLDASRSYLLFVDVYFVEFSLIASDLCGFYEVGGDGLAGTTPGSPEIDIHRPLAGDLDMVSSIMSTRYVMTQSLQTDNLFELCVAVDWFNKVCGHGGCSR